MSKAQREMHGLSWGKDGKRRPLHVLWLNMRQRCNNPKHPDYAYYGGRGIKVCSRWDVFKNFFEDVGEHPGKGWTLDHIDGDKDYEKSNCRWATRQTQAQNRAYCSLNKTKADEIRTKYKMGRTQVSLANEYNVTQGTVSQVIRGVTWK